jgi:uncharacterized protein (DUF433 family)
MASQTQLSKRIVRDPAVLAGKPVVKGTRIPVELVLAKLAANPDLAELFADFPRLSLEDVRACLDYARLAVSEMERAKPLIPPLEHQPHA